MKVFIVKINVVFDYEVCEDGVRLFVEPVQPRTHVGGVFDRIVRHDGWEVSGDNACSDELDCYEDGYYAQNHINVAFYSTELEVPAEILKTELDKLNE